MPVLRVFVGWDRPLCETVPEWLLRDASPGTVDLRGIVVGVPTRQSSWRLRAALPLTAHDRCGAALLGPEIVTASVLVSPPDRPGVASEVQSLLAWCAVLRSVPAGELDAFLGRQRPDSATGVLQIARRLLALRRELADGALSIADVAARGAEVEEAERWTAMAELERRYVQRLTSWGVRDEVNEQLAHAAAATLDPAVRCIVLAAVPDPPKLLLTMLETWSARGGTVEILVAAPESEADAFDDWGRPLPDAWAHRRIALDDHDIVLAANPGDQASRIAALLQEAGYGPDASKGGARPAIAIGVPDREAIAPLQRELATLGFPAFDPQNLPLSDTALFRLVEALLAWREHAGYAETAALLRHPDVLATLLAPTDVIRELDEVQSKHIPVDFADLARAAERVGIREDNDESSFTRPAPQLLAALRTLAGWRAVFKDHPLSAALRTILREIHARRWLQAGSVGDGLFERAGETVDAALRELADAEAAGQAGAEAADAFLIRLQGGTIKSERAAESLDLEGWLELGWNPAPVLCVAGLNEGLVPDGRVGDVFLPDTLRRILDLRDDRLRVARDAFLLTALCAQRTSREAPGRVVLFVGKRSAAGDPLRPSRLLFRCSDDELVARARKLFRDPPPPRGAAAHSMSFRLDPSLVPPNALSRSLPDKLSPSAIKDYLKCPFRFYLHRVLKMETIDDRAREPDARGFGTLCHAAVEAMARDKGRIWACGDADPLAQWLAERVDDAAVTLYGTRPWLGVDLVVETAKRRLRAFAERQVAWHADGWEIAECEVGFPGLAIEGSLLGGRIDRIDRHRDGRVCVLDYKTTDRGIGPREAHWGSSAGAASFSEAVIPESLCGGTGRATPKRWVDLQLPLYRELARVSRGECVLLGYVLLPAALSETAFAVWDEYNDALHAHAMTCARAVVRHIRDCVFWPPASPAPRHDDFADLLLGDAEKAMVPPAHHWSVRTAGGKWSGEAMP